MKYILDINVDSSDIILHTTQNYIFEKGKKYSNNDEIECKENVTSISIVYPNRDMYGNIISYSKIELGDYEIKAILEKINEINEKPSITGIYSNMPF
jgi:hypothetical protein